MATDPKTLLAQAKCYQCYASSSQAAGLIELALLAQWVGGSPPGPTCYPKPSGLIAWYRAENNTLDQMGNANGAAVGAVAYAPGEVGKAFSFPGDGTAVVSLNPLPAALKLPSFTVELWRKRAVANNTGPLGKGRFYTVVGGNTFFFGEYGQALGGVFDGALVFSIAGKETVSPNLTFPDDTLLHHAAFAFDGVGQTCSLWLDGQPEPNNPAAVIGTPDYTAAIGSIPAPDNTGFAGLIDELSIYNRVLTDAEILGIFTAGVLGKCT